MPFIRQTRDKRGFEQTTVLHAYHGATGGNARPRVLYLFRSPANLRVGRSALDAEVKEALEHTHPDLSFDWTTVTREVVQRKPEPERPMRRPQKTDERGAQQGGQPEIVVPADDPSPLGRTLGPAEAARLRQRYSELVQRIGRRVPAPEERERLLERARRLNPDDWQDEGAIRSGQGTFDSAWGQLASELPSRRRGRRGGRRHEGGRTPSAIIETRKEDGDVHEQSADPGSPAGGGDIGFGDGGGSDRSESDTEAPTPGSADDSIND